MTPGPERLAADLAALLRSVASPADAPGRPRVLLLGAEYDGWAEALASHGLRAVADGSLADMAVVPDPGWLPAHGFQRRRLLRDLRNSLTTGGLLALSTGGPARAELAGTVAAGGYQVLPASLPYLLARAEPLAGPDLAGVAYARPPGNRLDLRWSPDEIDWLEPDPRRIWADLLAAGPTAVTEAARAYRLDDPFGGRRLADALGSQFGRPFRPEHLTLGAGVASLLRDLIALADGGPVLAGSHCFADVPGWARRMGSTVHLFDDSAGPAGWLDVLHRVRPAMLLIDRPTVFGTVHPISELEPVLHAADGLGTIVVVDESYANYLGAGASVAPLTGTADNLVVLRGLSKGYCLGGMRVGLAISSAATAPAVRELVPALQVSELSAVAGMRLLAAGDIFGRLRERVRTGRPVVAGRLREWGLRPAYGHPALPWLTLTDPAAERLLLDHGIVPKVLSGGGELVVKVAVPLSDARRQALREAAAPIDG